MARPKLKQLNGGSVAGEIITDSSGVVSVLKHNLSASVDPTPFDNAAQGYAVGSRWINTATGSVFVCVDASGAATWILLSPPIFGQNHNFSSSDTLSTTTSTAFQNKVTISVTLPAGTFYVGWSYGWGYASTGNDFVGRVVADGVTVFDHQEEPQDSGVDQIHSVSGFTEVVLAAGTRDFTLDYRSAGGHEARIQQARLVIWRVA